MVATHSIAPAAEPAAHGATGAVDCDGFRPEHLEQWLAVTREYLFAVRAPACPSTRSTRRRQRTNDVSLQLARLEAGEPVPGGEPALRAALLPWAHRHMLRLLRHAERSDSSPLRALEGVVRFQVSFAASHPLVPAHLLAGPAAEGDSEGRRRMQNVVGHNEAKLAKLIERARAGGEVGAAVDPRAAARLLIALLHGLLIRMHAGLHTPGELRREAADLVPIYLDALRRGAPRPANDVNSREHLR